MSSEKKHKSGFTLLKEKLAKVEVEKAKLQDLKTASDKFAEEWKNRYFKKKEELAEAEATIKKQSAKISQLSGDLSNAQSDARDYRRKYEEAVSRMGWLRRFIYGYNVPQFTDEDHWHD